MTKKKRVSSFYDKPLHARLGQKIIEGLISAGVVYLISPTLLQILAPLQAQLNASAINNGQTPSNVGSNSVANKLINVASS